MKIWEANLVLVYNMNDKQEAIFSFNSDDKDYTANEDTKEWISWKGWSGNKAPMNMTTDRTYSGELKIVKGFDRELKVLDIFHVS